MACCSRLHHAWAHALRDLTESAFALLRGQSAARPPSGIPWHSRSCELPWRATHLITSQRPQSKERLW
eukprot:7160195-Alexandrium_andersonii.AAC.1